MRNSGIKPRKEVQTCFFHVKAEMAAVGRKGDKDLLNEPTQSQAKTINTQVTKLHS